MKEEAKVAIRNVRRDANKHAEQGEKDKLMTEDEAKICKEEIQNLTKKYEGDVDSAADSKERTSCRTRPLSGSGGVFSKVRSGCGTFALRGMLRLIVGLVCLLAY